MPRCGRSDGRRDSSLSPRKVIAPEVGATTPLMVLNRVDLPAPFGPTSVTKLLSATDRLTSERARRPPYATERFFTSSIPSRQPFLAEVGLDHGGVLDDAASQARAHHPPLPHPPNPAPDAHP